MGIFLLTFILFMPSEADAATLDVGKNKQYTSITEALKNAAPGDEIRIFPGEYKEHLLIDKPVTLSAAEPHKAKIFGTGKEHVIIVESPNVTINGFEISGSGHNFLDNDAGIMVRADGARITNNRFYDVLFAIYLHKASNANIVRNEVTGLGEKPFSERGNGIHLFYAHDNKIEDNRFYKMRDGMYFEFSNRNFIRYNEVTDSRYGIHYMWSNDNHFEKNRFAANLSGAAIMFSKNLLLTENIFENNRGYRAFGMFFQTSEETIVHDNLFINNSLGLYSDLSRANQIYNNTFLANDIGMEMLGSNWDNEIYGNNFIDNLQQVSVNELRVRDKWNKGDLGNYWSDYEGLDMAKDGIGDTPYRSGNLFEYWMARYPHMRLFVETPTSKMLEAVDRMFPVVSRPGITDSQPLTQPARLPIHPENILQPKEQDHVIAKTATFFISLLLVLSGIAVSARLRHVKPAVKKKPAVFIPETGE